MEDVKDQSKEQSSKVRKKYEEDLANLTRVLGGSMLFKPTKLVPDEVMNAVKELAKEEKQKLIDSFKTRATEAIQKQREHLKNVERLKKEFNDKVEQSMKDFSTTVTGLFKDLSKIENIEKDYYDILIGKTSSDENEEKNEDIPPAQL